MPLIVSISGSGLAGCPVLNYTALQTTPAATASILNSTLPLMVPLLSWIIAAETPPARTVAGIAISFIGVVWIIGRGDLTAVLFLYVGEGELLVLLAVAGYALYSVLLRYRPEALSDAAFLATLSLATTVLLLPFWIAERESGRSMPLEPHAIISVLFIGIFASLVAAAIWNRCVATLGSTLTGASFHLTAVYSSALAFLLLGERVHTFQMAGIALILIGFSVAVLPRRLKRGVHTTEAVQISELS